MKGLHRMTAARWRARRSENSVSALLLNRTAERPPWIFAAWVATETEILFR